MQLRLAEGLTFTKMHGLGNNFVIIAWPQLPEHDDPALAALAWTLCHQQMGVGADGLSVIAVTNEGALAMRHWNADGSTAEQCVNALRCVALYHFMCNGRRRNFTIETPAGLHAVEVQDNGEIRVTLGVPILDPAAIPVRVKQEQLLQIPLSVPQGEYEGAAVSMGNPHLIIERGRQAMPLHRLGPLLEKHDLFPEGVNVTIAAVNRPDHIQACTWERGVGLTLACGSAACATAVAFVLRHRCERAVTVSMPGGDLRVIWPAEQEPVVVQAKASFVCEGTWTGEAIPSSAPTLDGLRKDFASMFPEEG